MTSEMKAVGLTRYLPVTEAEAFLDVTLPKPVPQGRDILVEVKAVAVNPVDTKVRAPKDKVEARRAPRSPRPGSAPCLHAPSPARCRARRSPTSRTLGCRR
ncbi:hypothetical protein [Cereibacter johrii]